MARQLVIVAREHPDLYVYLRERFASEVQAEVLLDRRVGPRRAASLALARDRPPRLAPHVAGTFLNGLRSGASPCGTARSRLRISTLSAGLRWRAQSQRRSGRAPRPAFGSRAVRPNDTRREPMSIASATTECSSARYTVVPR